MRAHKILDKSSLFQDSVVEATRHLEATGWQPRFGESSKPPAILAYTPWARVNPFQQLLYSRGLDHGVAAVPALSHCDVAAIPWTGTKLCHLHWLGNITAVASSDDEATNKAREFIAELDELLEIGVRLIWTVHNVLPHGTKYPVADCWVRQELAKRASAIHLMSEQTVDDASSYFEIPRHKCFMVPHPSYQGVYGNYMSRHAARFEIGVDPDEFVFLFFGSVQFYKGVFELVRSYIEVRDSCRDTRLRLVIAGKATDTELARDLGEACRDQADISLDLRAATPEETQIYMTAADACVCPYQRGLNSGVALLAFTFGVPVVAPRLGEFPKLLADDRGFLYPPNDREGLVRALQAACHCGDRQARRERILAHVAQHDPRTISDRFFDELFKVLA